MKEVVIKLNDLLKKNKELVVATVIESNGSAPQIAGSKMLITSNELYGTVGGGAIEYAVVEEAKKLLGSKVKTKRLGWNLSELGMSCGGGIKVFLEHENKSDKLFIFGAGHICQAMLDMVLVLGFDTTIIDDRTEIINSIKEKYSNKLNYLNSFSYDKLSFDEDTYIAIMTNMHEHDEEVLKNCIEKSYKYLGLVASKKKVKVIKDNLKVDEIKNFYSPVGLSIEAISPYEIAISICAEIISIRNKGRKSK